MHLVRFYLDDDTVRLSAFFLDFLSYPKFKKLIHPILRGGLRGDACPPQYSGVCFLNKHPCGVMPAMSLMTAAF